MDNRFTKKRIANLLAYDWIKMIAIICGIVIVWALAFTIGAPRASTGQVFDVYYFNGSGNFQYTKTPSEFCEEFKNQKVFSYDILDFGTREITSDMYAEILMTSTSVQEGDIMITVDTLHKLDKNDSPFRIFVDGYGGVLYSYDQLVIDAKQYCLVNGFVVETSAGVYALDEQKITNHFATRMAKDPRFKKVGGERYNEGVLQEIQRIKSVWNNALMLEECMATHPEICYSYTRYTQAKQASPEDYSGEEYANEVERIYGINLGKLLGGETQVTSEFAYTLTDENGEVTSVSADGIIMCVYNYKIHQEDLQYETIAFVNAMIKRYSNFLNQNTAGLIA